MFITGKSDVLISSISQQSIFITSLYYFVSYDTNAILNECCLSFVPVLLVRYPRLNVLEYQMSEGDIKILYTTKCVSNIKHNIFTSSAKNALLFMTVFISMPV